MQLIPGWTLLEPGETDILGMDFATELGGATLLSAIWTCSVFVSSPLSDPNPSAVLNGGSFILLGTQTWQPVKGGIDGVLYRMDVVAVTSDGRAPKNWAIIPCSMS